MPHVVQASTFKLLLWFHIFPRLKYQHSNKSGFQFRRRQTISIPFCKKSANSMTNRNQAAREPSWKLLQYLQSTTFTKLRLSVKFVVTSCSWESTYTYTALHWLSYYYYHHHIWLYCYYHNCIWLSCYYNSILPPYLTILLLPHLYLTASDDRKSIWRRCSGPFAAGWSVSRLVNLMKRQQRQPLNRHLLWDIKVRKRRQESAESVRFTW